jgi:hypothetical protein
MSIKLQGATSGSVSLDVPAAVSGGDISLTLPNGVGSANQFLKNSGTAGTLEFAALASSNMPTGSILQSKTTTITDVQSTQSTSAVNISGLSVTITPTSSTSKMVLMASIGVSGCTTSDFAVFFYFGKGGSVISGATGDAFGNRTRCVSFARSSANVRGHQTSLMYEDDHDSSSALTYTVMFSMESSGGTAFVNRLGDTTDAANRAVTSSSLTVMEVAQ